MAPKYCVICQKKGIKKVAVPAHIVSAHAMTWDEYKREIKDPEYLKKLDEEHKKRGEKAVEEFEAKKILANYWFRPETLSGLMRGFVGFQGNEQARRKEEEQLAAQIDLSKFKEMEKAYVENLHTAEALLKTGEWKTLEIVGGGTKEVKDDAGRTTTMRRKNKTWVLERI